MPKPWEKLTKRSWVIGRGGTIPSKDIAIDWAYDEAHFLRQAPKHMHLFVLDCKSTPTPLILYEYPRHHIFNHTNIAKGECKDKRKSHFRLDSAEPYPIFYKYNERCVQNKTNTLVFHTESYLISRFGKDLFLFCSGSEGTIIYSIPNTRSIVTK